MVHLLKRQSVPLFQGDKIRSDTMKLLRVRIRELKHAWSPNATWQHHHRLDLFLKQVTDNELHCLLRGHERALLSMMKHILAGTALYDVRMKMYSMQDARLCPYMRGYSWWDGTPIRKVIDAEP